MAWEIPNIFTGNAFSAISLTTMINNVPYAPNFLGSQNIFAADGVRTTDVGILSRNGALEIVATSERGSPPPQSGHPKRDVRKATAAHIALEGTVYADEVQGAFADGMVSGQPELETAQGLLEDRLNGPFGLRARIELTHEYHRLGGIQGIVVDKDGSTLYNWYQFFDIAPMADGATNFGALTADKGTFEMQCNKWVREMLRELEGLPVTTMVPVVLCGDNYYDQVYSNKEVKAARATSDTGRDSDVFKEIKAFSHFYYGGITWANYRGTKDGKVGIGTDEARLFPMGVTGLFQMLFAPPDIMGMTNMKGLPVHAFMPPERQTSRQAVVEAQSNPLTICLRPRALRRLTMTG
ncbi:major capsid protein [Dongia soli]|uniref:Major capsid protein n=1 Tax=Dongia soli TaxID=600628 RepID=A0ABU5E7L9_9PROT|nr:major capsid protein [Dongia soli]MDY0882301.1 major capsid protein [Dongia soli]